MKAALASLTIARFTTEEYRRESRALKTWALANEHLLLWAADPATGDNHQNTLLVQPRWQNGLVLHEVGFTSGQARDVGTVGLGPTLELAITKTYAANKRLQSRKAAMAREVLARCSFTDEQDVSEDARTFDVVSRALHAMYPDEATIHVDRIRAWMLDGGRIR